MARPCDIPVTAVYNHFRMGARRINCPRIVKHARGCRTRYDAQADEADPMPVRPVTDAASAAPALTAFLRGVERRGAVFARLQAGDPDQGLAALASAMASFRAVAARTPFSDWPRRFWALLLATPQLREPVAGGWWPEGFQALERTGRGPRAALLLRLVAHVSEADAAAVLGVGRPVYRMALRRALPRRPDGSADAEAWRELGEAAQRALRELSPETLAELARLRQAALEGSAWTPAAPEPEPEPRPRPRWLWPATGLVATAAVAGIVAVQLLSPQAATPGPGPEGIVREELPATPAAGTWDADLLLLAHPDFELLANGRQDPAMRDPAFHAWLVHQLEGLPPIEDPAGEAAGPEAVDDAAAAAVMPPELQEHAASLPPAEARRLARRQARLQAMPAHEVLALREEAMAWDALDLSRQRARRDAWQAWNRLPQSDRMLMRQAAAAYAELPAQDRADLADEFAALDALERNGWQLGPRLGADWPQLHPLFALVPVAQQEALLDVLMSMGAVERADLAVVAQRTPPGEREALRQALLTTPPGNRPAWLRNQAGR